MKGWFTPNPPVPVLMVTGMETGTFFSVALVSPYCASEDFDALRTLPGWGELESRAQAAAARASPGPATH